MRLTDLLTVFAFSYCSQAALAYRGVDWSSVIVEEKAGKAYSNPSGTKQPLETILKASGVNTVRSRLWVNPSDGNYNLAYNLQLAARAQAAGLQFYLDFHYSDTWADPGHNNAPAAWASQNMDTLTTTIRNYTRDSLDAFAAKNLPIALVSLGNEITAGLLWPAGQQSKNGFGNIAKLLGAAAQGARASKLKPSPKLMIHLDNGWNWDTQKWWYDGVMSAGGIQAADYDVQGVSYYPFYNEKATLAALQSSLTNMKNTYGKEVMVVETDWPTSCPSPSYAFPADAKNIPFSADGQTQWLQAVAKRVSAAGGTGLFYWEPAWIDNANLGSSCAYNLMVDSSGKALSSLAAFGTI